MGAAVWQSASLSGQFTFESITLELFAFGPRVQRMLWTVYWWKICPVTKKLLFAMGDWGMILLYPVKTRYKLASLYSLLSAGKAQKMVTKQFLLRSQSQ